MRALAPRLKATFLQLASLITISPSFASNWPGFRGPAASGVSATTAPPIVFGPTTHLAWKVALPPGLSSPVIWQDVLFLTGTVEKNLATLCLDRLTGRKLWEQLVPVEKLERVHRDNSPATPTPVTDGKAVYVYFGSLGLLAYDFSGKELWRKPLPLPKTFQNQGTGTSPILAAGKLIVFIQLGNDSHLLAVDPHDGHELWRAPLPIHNNSYATPVTWQEPSGGFVGMVCGARFAAFRLSDGQETWWINELGRQACSTPIVLGDRLLLATAGVQGEAANITPPPPFAEAVKLYGSAQGDTIDYDQIPPTVIFTDRQASGGQGNMTLKNALRFLGAVQTGAKFNREQWEKIRANLTSFATGPFNQTVVLAARTGGRNDVTSSHVIWRETKGVPEMPSPVVWQDRAYLIRSGGFLACRDVTTGQMIFEKRIDSPGGYYASPVAAQGRVYVASDRGTITVFQAERELVILARNEIGEPILASPALAQKNLYVRSSRHLWSFGDTAP